MLVETLPRKTLPSDDLGEKKIVAKRPEILVLGFVSSAKHCSEVFFAGFLFVF